MKKMKCLSYTLCAVFVVTCFHIAVLGQSSVDRNQIARMAAFGSSVRWEISAPNSGTTLTVATPDGRVFRQEFKAGAAPDFNIVDKKGERLPDGQYTYELRLDSVFSADFKAKLAKQRKDDEPEAVRAARKSTELPALVQSGTFSILNGSVVNPDAVETSAKAVSQVIEQPQLRAKTAGNAVAKSLQHHPLLVAMPDQVIPDDLIVQGSACIGLDCINNESFGFDTIRLKENNTRIKFDDTSTAAGFPANDWQLTANDSASGGANKFSIDDISNSRTPFTITGGAPSNSIFVNSSGRLGLKTSTPVVDIHVVNGNTPTLRLEQDGSSGFSPQTWDVAGNEANFFIRDVTGGSKLSFRIRPGAPTSSIDVATNGNVGIGTQSPGNNKLDVAGNIINVGSESGTGARGNNTTKLARVSMPPFLTASLPFALFGAATTASANIAAFGGEVTGMAAATQIDFVTAANNNTDTGTVRMVINSIGRVGIGTNAPDQVLSVIGDASKSVGGGSWQVFSDERLKNIKGNFNSGLSAVMQLQPLRYAYKQNNPLGLGSDKENIGFGAQALQQVIPEAVTRNDNGYLQVNNDPILWTMLNAIKEQQKEIEQLKSEIKQLRASRKRK